MKKTKHIVFFSSGIGSYITAKRVIQQVGVNNTMLVFADTLMEDEDNYRFLNEAVKHLRCNYRYLTAGLTIFDLWKKHRAISNNRIPFCSTKLKQDVCRKWLRANYRVDNCKLYVGIDIWEEHRRKDITTAWDPYIVKYPMCVEPYLSKQEMLDMALADGLRPPRLYDQGFAHANCGGACVRAGLAQWSHLYKVNPSLFEQWMIEEQCMRLRIKKDISILTHKGKPFPLSNLKVMIDSGKNVGLTDFGNECSCFSYKEDPS